MPRRSIVIFVVIVVVCATLFAYTRSRNSQKDTQQGRSSQRGGNPAQQLVPVTVASARVQDVPVYLNGLGSVTAFNTVTVKSRVDGQVNQVSFREGQDVKQGQLLATIDPRPFQVALSQAEATLYRDQSQLTISKRNFDRYSDLFKQGIVSRQDFDAQEATKGQLEGTVRADQAQIDNAKLNLSYTRITAPMSGKVGLRLVDPGNVVHANDPNGLMVITQLQPISVVFTIPEDSLPEVLKRSQGKPLQVDVFSRDGQTKLTSGSLVTVNNQVDPTTGTVRLKAVFDNKDGMLWPNQFVNARLLLDVRKNSVVVPAAAIQRGSQGTFVFVLKPDNTVDLRPVQAGITEGNLVAIDQGLSAGDQVVTDGQDKLQAGSHVQPSVGSRPQSQQAQAKE